MKSTIGTFHAVFLALAFAGFLIQPAESSAEGGVISTITSATISATEAGYRFQIELDEKGGLKSLVATYKGKSVAVPKEELPSLKEADLRQVHIKAPHDHSMGPQESVILIIPFAQEFREDPEGKPGDDRVRVSNVVRLRFDRGEMLRWEMAVSVGEKSNAWNFSFKDKGMPVEDNGKGEELANPYWTWSGIRYSTPWSKED